MGATVRRLVIPFVSFFRAFRSAREAALFGVVSGVASIVIVVSIAVMSVASTTGCSFDPSGQVSGSCSVNTDCDDKIACTVEFCDQGFCSTPVPDDAKCMAGEVCQATTGCEAVVECQSADMCDDNDECTEDACDDAGVCRWEPIPRCGETPDGGMPDGPDGGMNDTTPPDTTITGQPANPSVAATAEFVFQANEASTFECSLDSTTNYAPCTSPKTYSGLVNGDHTFRVRATDAAGNPETNPASATWNVEQISCTITCRGTATWNGTQHRYIEVTGSMRPSYVNDADCVPPANARVRHGFDGPGGSWPQYDASGTYTGGGGAQSDLYDTDLPDAGSPYIVMVALGATQMNVAVDGCGYIDLNAATDSVGGRCQVANVGSGTNTNCQLNPAGTAVLLQ